MTTLHRAAAVSRVEARYLPRKRLACHPAKFEPALTLARSDWQKRHVDEDAIAHGSESRRGKFHSRPKRIRVRPVLTEIFLFVLVVMQLET